MSKLTIESIEAYSKMRGYYGDYPAMVGLYRSIMTDLVKAVYTDNKSYIEMLERIYGEKDKTL